MRVPVDDCGDSLVVSRYKLHYAQLFVEKIWRTPAGARLHSGDARRFRGIRGAEFDAGGLQIARGRRNALRDLAVDELEVFRVFAVFERAVAPCADGVGAFVIVSARDEDFLYAQLRVNQLLNVINAVVSSFGVIADEINRADGDPRLPVFEHDRARPQIVMFACGQAFVAEAGQIDSVVFVLRAWIDPGIAFIIFELFARVPHAVAVLVVELFAPYAGRGYLAVPIGILAEWGDGDCGGAYFEFGSRSERSVSGRE